MTISREKIAKRVLKVVRDESGTDNVSEESWFIEDLGLDSMDTVEIVMGVEEEFDIEIHDDEVEDIETVGQLVDLVVRLTETRS